MKITNTQPGSLKLQISPTRRIADMLTVWFEPGPEVDIVIDVRYGLKMRPGSVKALYIFHLLGCVEPEKVQNVVDTCYAAIEPGGDINFIETDFDYITRSVVGGDLSPEEFSKQFSKKSYVTLQTMLQLLTKAGIPREKQILWQETTVLNFSREHHELVITGRKTND